MRHTHSHIYRFILGAMFVLIFLTAAGDAHETRASNRSLAANEVLQRSFAKYASLTSYSDTGVVVYEYGTASKDRHTFTTYFSRAPRSYYFDFKKESGERFVIWGDPEAFHTWWSA